MERYRKGLGAETPRGPIGQDDLGGGGSGGSLRLLAGCQGRVLGGSKEAPRGGGGEE